MIFLVYKESRRFMRLSIGMYVGLLLEASLGNYLVLVVWLTLKLIVENCL